MDGYKDFQGKTLDDAIREATAYFDVAREKLEIDIVQDAKSGVFGLIGARKAKVRARRVQLKNTVDELVGRGRDLRASFRDEFDSKASVSDADDAFEGNAPRERRDDNRREDKRRDESRRDARDGRREENQDNRADSRSEDRQDEGRERSSRRGRPERQERSERQDRQPRSERQEAGQFDERGEDRRDERRGDGEERRSNSRRQRNERSDRQERSERANGDRSERNQERSRRSDRNQERNQDRSQERQDAMQSEGNFEPMEDENGVLMDAESRERSSRRRRRGRGRSRSRTDANGADSNALDASLENGDSQEAVDFAEASASEMDANEAPRRNQDGRRNNRRDNDGRRSGDRRANGNRRDNDRRDSDRRENESRRGDRRSNSERNERPYRNADAPSQAPSDFDAENEYAQANQLMDDQAYDRPEGLPDIPLESLDQELVRSVALEVTERLVFPIIGPADLTVEATDGRVKIGIDCGENSGLLIGREGQTLASIQYLASRIIARKLGAAVRVQLDTGDYRERQDEKLRELALSFAERVRATGRPQSTRPLSSYHRRVVHLVLQDDEDIVTRSKGEGPLKRVIILRRRKNSAE